MATTVEVIRELYGNGRLTEEELGQLLNALAAERAARPEAQAQASPATSPPSLFSRALAAGLAAAAKVIAAAAD